LELLVAVIPHPLPEHLHDLGLRPAIDEDDEAEPEPGLVLGVEPVQLRQLVIARLGQGKPRQPGAIRGWALTVAIFSSSVSSPRSR
jgi:hypothetical protein